VSEKAAGVPYTRLHPINFSSLSLSPLSSILVVVSCSLSCCNNTLLSTNCPYVSQKINVHIWHELKIEYGIELSQNSCNASVCLI
jgi:hypothetical protein